MKTNKLMTTREAAARLGCSVDLARISCEKGRLTAAKMGRDWLIEEDRVFKAFKLGKPGRPSKKAKH